MDSLNRRLPPPLVFLLIAGAMWAWAGRPNILAPAAAFLDLVALILALGAFALNVSAILTFRSADTTVNPVKIENASVIVAHGVYAYTRNPMYLGLAILTTAWALHLASPLSALGPVALVAYLTRFQILPEERALEAKFGDVYRRYLVSVRRWI